jgi:hypothetical protein
MLGYALWTILANYHTKIISVIVPVCFYGQDEHVAIKAPDNINIELRGKKRELALLDIANLALHIDASKLKKGANPIVVHNESLLLPDSICVVHYHPTKIFVDVQGKTSLHIAQTTETIT